MSGHVGVQMKDPGGCTAGPGGESGLAGFWSAAGDALLMFPLSRTVRESLVQLACASMAQQGPAAASIRGSQGLQMRPQEGATITSAPVVGILLQLLLGCDDAAERNATLEALHCLIGEPSHQQLNPKSLRCSCCSSDMKLNYFETCALYLPNASHWASCATRLLCKSCLAPVQMLMFG